MSRGATPLPSGLAREVAMKIAVDGSLLGARFSGVERSVAQLIQHLPQVAGDDHEITVFVGNAFDSYRARYTPDVFDPRLRFVQAGFDNTHRLSRFWWQQVVLPRLVHASGADVFHAPAYICPSLMSAPHVVTLYDLLAFEHPQLNDRLNRWHYRLAVPAGARRAQRVIVPSGHTRQAVAKYLPRIYERCVRVPLGIEARFFEPPAADDAARRAQYRLPSEYLLWVGNVEPKKNVPLLLEAMKLLRDRGADVPKLVIAGQLSWGANAVMEAFLTHHLQDRVMFLGRVRDADLTAVYRGATVFLFPSLSEGFGLPPLEAMASGVPVVVSHAAALPEVVGEAAIALPPTDVAAWAEGIVRIVGDSELRASQVAKGRSQVVEFTWRKCAEKTLTVYAEALQVGEDEYDHRSGRLRYMTD